MRARVLKCFFDFYSRLSSAITILVCLFLLLVYFGGNELVITKTFMQFGRGMVTGGAQ